MLPEGAEGELVVRGPLVTRGYYAKPEETAATVDAEGWLRSGDLGRIDPDNGHIILTGHRAVAQAYVIGVPDERMGEVGWAYVVPSGAAAIDGEELIALCRERLARFKVPVRVVSVSAADSR